MCLFSRYGPMGGGICHTAPSYKHKVTSDNQYNMKDKTGILRKTGNNKCSTRDRNIGGGCRLFVLRAVFYKGPQHWRRLSTLCSAVCVLQGTATLAAAVGSLFCGLWPDRTRSSSRGRGARVLWCVA